MALGPAQDEMGRLLAAAANWRAAGHAMALATVVKTWGSAPRRVGAHLLVRDDGLFEGSVSGGCVEGAVIAAAQQCMATASGQLLHYGVANEAAWEVGLACGGDISIMVQAVADQLFPAALFARIAEARDTGAVLSLATDLDNFHTIEAEAGDFVRRYDPPMRLMLVGAVHIAQALVPMAALLGYQSLIVDPRGAFAASPRFADIGTTGPRFADIGITGPRFADIGTTGPRFADIGTTGPRFAGVAVDDRWPDEALDEWRPDAASAVVTLTHDPKLDDPALIAALRSDAFYIAALGSRKTHAARLERLQAAGFDAMQLTRIQGPAGLNIGAANPAEIALSVAAQMVAAWRNSERAGR